MRKRLEIGLIRSCFLEFYVVFCLFFAVFSVIFNGGKYSCYGISEQALGACDPLDRFSQSLHHIVGIEWQMINPTFFFRYLKGRCHTNQFSGKNEAKLPTPPALITLPFRYGMGYRYLNVRVNSVNDASKSC